MTSAGLTPTDYPAITGDYGDYAVFNYFHFGATLSNQAIKGQVALLHTVTVNLKATAGQLTLTDGNGGPTVAVVDLTAQVPYTYDVKVNNGLWASTNAITGTPSVTVSYV